ncbi:hypothetical protein AMECASPLE_020376 [Ameca splendens]|uniref:Uncharacterized protein n=1 Tax=Ameca splendens TaxID=208324 RepID=A0ABV0Y351_9TELE
MWECVIVTVCVYFVSGWVWGGSLSPRPQDYSWPRLGVDVPGVLGLCVHDWICSSVDDCWRSLWARRCSSLGLLRCGCWVVPLGLSSALLWGGLRYSRRWSSRVPVLSEAFG